MYAFLFWLMAVAPLSPWVCEGWGDFDADGRITLDDFAVFLRCLDADELATPAAECDSDAI